MFALINNVIDRCFFTFTFILGLKLPVFIQKYQQRLAGQLAEASSQLNQFENIAQLHFDGSLITMITRYKDNTEASIISTGELIERLSVRVEYLASHLTQITQADYLHSVYQFIWHLDQEIARGTAEHFSMAIPLELNAITTGAALAIGALLLKELMLITIKRAFKTKKNMVI
jgi:deoxyxylulose-5-phosphate synthase